jgi:hypothetical protein
MILCVLMRVMADLGALFFFGKKIIKWFHGPALLPLVFNLAGALNSLPWASSRN